MRCPLCWRRRSGGAGDALFLRPGITGGHRAESQHPEKAHFKALSQGRRQRLVTASMQGYLIIQLDILGRQRGRQIEHALTVTVAIIHAFRQDLRQRDPMQGGDQSRQRRGKINTLRRHRLNDRHQTGSITLTHRLQHAKNHIAVQRAQHVADFRLAQNAIAKSDGLISQRQGIPHGTIGGATQLPQRAFIMFDMFGIQYMGQMLHDALWRHRL